MLLVSFSTLLTTITDADTLAISKTVRASLLTGMTNSGIVKYRHGILRTWQPSCPLSETRYMVLPGACSVQDTLAINNWKLLTDILVKGSMFLLAFPAAVGYK